MTEVILHNIVGGAWAFVIGSIIPLAIIFVIRSTKKIKLTGYKLFLQLLWRIPLAIIFFCFLFLSAFAIFGFMLGEMENFGTNLSGLTFFLSFLSSFFGGIFLIFYGYWKGKRSALPRDATNTTRTI
jgi:hypothetical protein